jgi:type II restriction/modification system DNA methylase subunit YeeA
MNTNELKRFAREARIKLLDQVGRKLEYVITTDTAELRGMSNQINDLRTQINKIGKDQVIEKVAYTWFNRLMALRFMDANGYNTPMVVTPIAGYLMPQLLQEAKAGNVEENLRLDRKRLNDLLDGKTQVADAQTEAYKLLLIASCNALNSVMPFMFERISDYTELLLPDDLLSDYSIITDVRSCMTEEDCKQEELIGWLYQFYIADKKDEVFADLKKNVKITAENIPAATQLFTPRWIVRYMVENTLGKLWLTLKPNSKLKDFMPYFIEAPEGNEPILLPEGVKGVTDIKFLDPCQGSGHVLVYAFDLFSKIYEEEGYNTNEIPGLILENNLFGIDIDERAAQLAAFALTMKGRSYYARFLRKPVKPNVIALENIDLETIEQTIKLPIAVGEKIINDHDELTLFNLTHAKNFGSLIQIDPEELKILIIEKGSIWEGQQEKLQIEATYLSNKYHCVITNPPYLGSKGMNNILRPYVEQYYSKSKADLMACFMEVCINLVSKNGYCALINQQSWMFLSTYMPLREDFLKKQFITSLIHLGPRTFPEISGEVVQSVTFVINKSDCKNNRGTYVRIVDVKDPFEKEKQFFNKNRRYFKSQTEIIKVPGSSIAYWVSSDIIKTFENSKALKNVADIRSGISTGDNDVYYRNWFEIENDKVELDGDIDLIDDEGNLTSEKKWFPIIRGGTSSKWFGNQDNVINLENNAESIKGSGNNYRLRTPSFYFEKGITWSRISSNSIAFREKNNQVNFGENSPCLFVSQEKYYQLFGLLNSKIPNLFLSLINPTLTFQVIDVEKIPINEQSLSKNDIVYNVKESIGLAKWYWSLREDYWSFEPIPLNRFRKLSDYLSFFEKEIGESIKKLHLNEEKINKFFISEYNLLNELDFKVALDEIDCFQDVINKEDLKELTKKLERPSNSDFVKNYSEIKITINNEEIIKRLLSYSVGCLFGRYSVEKMGIIIGNSKEGIEDFKKAVDGCIFLPDEDNIIPVLEGEYFTDDIIGRIKNFFGIALDGSFLNENIEVIQSTLNRDLRKYFVKDYFSDHVKSYKKRPIYWMFSSPKGHFKALIYMHRYRSDTISTMLNDYLRVYIGKLESEKQSLNQTSISESASAREQTLATKRIAEIEVMLKDLKIYERTLFDYAAKKIEIDLDDGVKVNYLKFKEILVPIKGLDKDEE